MPPPSPPSQEPQRPRFRAACDACHNKKIRCKLAPGESTCAGCANNGRSCFFTPCRQVGRPRTSPKTHSGVLADISVWDELAPLSRPSSSDREQDISQGPMLGDSHSISDGINSDTMAALNWVPFSTDMSLAIPLDGTSVLDPLKQFQVVSEQTFNNSPTPQAVLAGVRGDEGIFMNDVAEQPRTESMLFTTLLRTCTEFQSILDDLQSLKPDKWTSELVVQEFLQSKTHKLDRAGHVLIDATGPLAVDPLSRNQPGAAVLSLAMTSSLKLLEICDWSTKNLYSNAGHVNHALLMRRIDGNLVQARTIFTRVRTINTSLTNLANDALSKTVQIHSQIQCALQTEWESLH